MIFKALTGKLLTYLIELFDKCKNENNNYEVYTTF